MTTVPQNNDASVVKWLRLHFRIEMKSIVKYLSTCEYDKGYEKSLGTESYN